MSTIAWPQVMTAATAATYCGERSVRAFRRRVGSVYPVGRVWCGAGVSYGGARIWTRLWP